MNDWSGIYIPRSLHLTLNKLGCYPSIPNLIESQINFYKWWEKSRDNFIIRKNKDYPFLIESVKNNVRFIASDNEACASFYQFIYDKPIVIKKDLFGFFKQNQLKVGIPKSEYPQQKITINKLGLKNGMSRGIRQDFDLKLSHYLDAAKMLTHSDNIKKRAAIYLSPFNIFLTPNPRKFQHYLNGKNIYDVGENNMIKEHLHSHLIKDVLAIENGRHAYKLYCNMCEINFDKQIEKIFSIKEGTVLLEFEKRIKQQSFDKEKSIIPQMERKKSSRNSITLKNFILKKSYVGRNLKIVISKDSQNPIFDYNHDDILSQLGERITNLPCWDKYGYYTKSGSVLPRFCDKLIGINVYS